MHWHDDIIAGLPEPDDREPRSLRADIADELADHLACAMQRELKRTDDEAAARKKVLERFGDIKKIARRLWWDAMRNRIMKDRLFLIGTFIVMIALVAAFVLPWAAEQNKINAAILAKLEQLSAPPPSAATQPAVPENWAKLAIRVVRGEGGGLPVPDVRLDLTGKAFTSDDKDRTLSERTDSAGRAEYGPILPGVYSLAVYASDLQLTLRDTITLYPSQQPQKVIHYPDLPGPARLRFRIEPQDALRRLDAALRCQIAPDSALGSWSAGPRGVLIDPAGAIISQPHGVGGGRSSRPLPGSGSVSIEYFSKSNPLEPVSELPVAPVRWKLAGGVTVGIGRLPARDSSPEASHWQYTRETQFTPEGPISISTAAGETSVITIQVPDEILRNLEVMKRRRDGVADVPAQLIADPEWLALREASEQAARTAIQLAREQGRSGAAIEAYQRAQEADERLRDKEAAMFPQPSPPRLPSPGIFGASPEEQTRRNREAELRNVLGEAARSVQELYLSLGPDDARLSEAVQRMKELQNQLDELKKPATAPAEAVPLPAKPHTGLPPPGSR